MRFRVTWDPAAVDELQRIYDDALDKEGVVNAVTRIGLELEAVADGSRRIAGQRDSSSL